MKKASLLIFIWLLLFSISIFAQTENDTIADWKLFQPQSEAYSIELPNAAQLVFEDKEEKNQRFSVKFNGRFLFIFSEKLKSAKPDKTLQSFIFNSVAKPVETILNGFKCTKYSFKYSDDYFHTLWLITTKNKIYAFHSASETEKDEIVDRFFNSLKFDRKIFEKNSSEINYKLLDEAEGFGKTSRNADKSNIFIPISQTQYFLAKSTFIQDNPLQLTSKPRANYTDFARFFDIQGSVRLKVTFLSTGEIGAVEVVKKLPFGLTANAIEAARKIRFEPMRKDGTAINVTKSVEYSFTIY